jgi:hypothetical protein
MSVTFDGNAIFGSGPMRVHEGARGSQILVQSRLSPFDAGTQSIGELELNVLVRGRLAASDDAALWTAINAVHALLTEPPTTATLTDARGRSWSDMSFINFTVTDRIDRGREASVGFEATFVRFLP